MSWFSRCSWRGGPFNDGNCRRCKNVSFGDEFVNNSEPVLNDETPDFSYPPSQTQTSSLDQWHCFHCEDPLERGERCKRCFCKWCGSGLSEGFCFICASSNENSSNNDLNSNSFNDPPNNFTYPPQPQYETYLCELCGNNSHYEKRIELEQAANLAVQKEQAAQSFTPYWNFPIIDNDDEEYTIQYREYLERSSKAITPVLPIEEPDNSLIKGDEHLSTIPETESYEVTKSSVEDLVPIPSESEGVSDDTDDDSFEDINYVEASPPDSELVSLEEVKDDLLREELLNINLLIAKIESLNDNPTPDCVLKSPSPFPIPVEDSDSFFEKSDTSLSYSDNSLPEFETFSDHMEETSSGSTTTHSDNSLPEYESFLLEI
ncbi:hypothetical protein Tco_1116289 [Tanacetum coccineum]